MNVARLELCKELYEVSGLDQTEKRWYGTLQFPDKCVAGSIDNFDGQGICPAYDLGYLLRKMPDICMLWRDGDTWHCDCEDAVMCEADTPEDATCKLVIELFKQGILVRDAS